MSLRIGVGLTTATVVLGVRFPSAVSAAPTTLRLDGIGPLKLGMTRASAERTGWLSHRSRGCEVASPVPVAYRLDGRRAPKALAGSAEFSAGRLTSLSFRAGVRTALGVRIGSRSSTLLSRYRGAGFTASSRYDATFGVTFLTVERRNRQRLGALASSGRVTQLAVPAVPVCE